MGKLTDMKVKNAKPGIHGDGAGLYLRVKPSGAKSFVLRVQFNGERKDLGLGGYPADLTLAEAREKAHHLRKLARQGKDAKAERDREKIVVPTFKTAMEAAHAEFSKGWSKKNSDSFKASLEQHIIPVKIDGVELGSRRIDHVTTADVIAALSAVWTEKPALAQKLRVRLLQVLSFAKARGWRTEATPDPRELRGGLAKRPKGGNFAAMPYKDVPAFVADQLGKEDTAGRLALLFTIFTGARSGETRSARWEHIDEEDREWNRPADLMKSGVKHSIALNDAALAILARAKSLSGGEGLIFPGAKAGRPLSDMTLSKTLRTAGRSETVHGFRSSFRTWAAERMPSIPWNVAEMSLAHSVGNQTEKAYNRAELLAMRRDLMGAWGRFIAPSLTDTPSNVIPIAVGR